MFFSTAVTPEASACELGHFKTRKREIDGIVEASRVTGCDSLIILTNNEEGEITEEGKTIKILPVWKWLLFQE